MAGGTSGRRIPGVAPADPLRGVGARHHHRGIFFHGARWPYHIGLHSGYPAPARGGAEPILRAGPGAPSVRDLRRHPHRRRAGHVGDPGVVVSGPPLSPALRGAHVHPGHDPLRGHPGAPPSRCGLSFLLRPSPGGTNPGVLEPGGGEHGGQLHQAHLHLRGERGPHPAGFHGGHRRTGGLGLSGPFPGPPGAGPLYIPPG
ncbi:MAG: hypothetical protein BWY88_01149 [Synergistetes bacterium ADurb.Bin520]|nr:MAG: hypothetical protein BWY88_01149 [Synergistetes bacterium ADurb.Bin520]